MKFLVLITLFISGCASAPNYSSKFHFVAMGDIPYQENHIKDFADYYLDAVNSEKPQFTIHVGDIKGGSNLCTDDILVKVRDQLNSLNDPVMFTPGDNEWTDCHRPRTRNKLKTKDDKKWTYPLERLAKIRELYYPDENSMGKRKIPLNRQSKTSKFSAIRENVMWWHDKVLFSNLHIVGSNNNYKSKDKSWKEEYPLRDEANMVWLEKTFAEASTARALVISFHASMDFSGKNKQEGFQKFLDLLTEKALVYKKPILLIHGDEHRLRLDRPLVNPSSKWVEPIANVTRLEVPGGYQNLGYMVIEVSSDAKQPWRFRPVIFN